MKKIIIVGFDGLSYSKIQRYKCKNLMLSTFGQIDLSDFEILATPELWGSFITGKRQHFEKVTKFVTMKGKERFDRVLKMLQHFYLGIRYVRNRATAYPKIHDKTDLNGLSIFEAFDAEAVCVPGYSELTIPASPLWVLYNVISEEFFVDLYEKEFHWRWKRFTDALKSDKELVMVHFFKWDALQHLFGNGKDKELYVRANEVAGDIRKLCDKHNLLFLSDHGLDGGHHSYDAFYSSNFIHFEGNPRMTDFYARIVAFAGKRPRASKSRKQRPGVELSKEDKERVKARLRSLGYAD